MLQLEWLLAVVDNNSVVVPSGKRGLDRLGIIIG